MSVIPYLWHTDIKKHENQMKSCAMELKVSDCHMSM